MVLFGSETTVSNDHNLVFDHASEDDPLSFTPGPGTVMQDPMFISARDFRLQSESPAIDAGNNARVPASIVTDAAGNARIAPPGGTVDIGAYENQDVTTTTTIATTPSTTTTTPPCSTIRCVLEQAQRASTCAGQTLPASVAAKLDRAIGRIEIAPSQTAKKATRLYKTAKRLLMKASNAVGKAARGKRAKLSTECASALREAIAVVIGRVGT
jgi:hypothetical protein